jgi:hypothetical protein
MMHMFMEEEAVDAANADEHFTILIGLHQLQEEENARHKLGGSKCGAKKSKPTERIKGHVMLYTPE